MDGGMQKILGWVDGWTDGWMTDDKNKNSGQMDGGRSGWTGKEHGGGFTCLPHPQAVSS